MKKTNVIAMFILLSISLSESYMPKIESSRALSFISSYGENGSESFGIVSQNLRYSLNPKMELFGNITLQMPMGSSSIYQQGYENNFNGLVECYILAIPFFGNTFLSTLIFAYPAIFIYKSLTVRSSSR